MLKKSSQSTLADQSNHLLLVSSPLVVIQLLKNVVEGGNLLNLYSNSMGFSWRRAFDAAARWAMTEEKLISNRGSATDVAAERRRVLGDGGGGKPFGGVISSIIIFFNSSGW